jgi:hypothetical protein
MNVLISVSVLRDAVLSRFKFDRSTHAAIDDLAKQLTVHCDQLSLECSLVFSLVAQPLSCLDCFSMA